MFAIYINILTVFLIVIVFAIQRIVMCREWQMSVMLTLWASNVFLYCMCISVLFAPITVTPEKPTTQILTTFAETHQEMQITQVLDIHKLSWCNV